MLNQRSLVIAISLVPAAAIVGLLLIPLWISVRVESDAGLSFGLRAYYALSSDPFSYPTLFNTTVFSAVAVLAELFFGVPSAWIVQRTNLPHKRRSLTFIT